MELNSIIFPAPTPSYTQDFALLYIPKAKEQKKYGCNYIPCLFLPYIQGSDKLLIYFHGNAEDVGSAQELLNHIRNTLKVISPLLTPRSTS